MADIIVTINPTAAPIAINAEFAQQIKVENVGVRLPGVKGDKGDSSDIIPATADTIGGVKVGSGLLITEDGTLSVDKSQIHEVPSGGEVNQVIKKASGTDYDYGWGDSVKIEAYGSTLLIL